MSKYTYIPRLTYPEYLELKTTLHKARIHGLIDNLWLFTSHDPGVYTCGRSFNGNSILYPAEKLNQSGREIHHIERGGDITYHGPSQIMIYPFIEVPDHDIEHLVRNLEKVILSLLEYYKLTGDHKPGFPGIWRNGSKIASIGIAVRKWVTMHGMALNVRKDDGGFSMIIPCGIPNVSMISLEECLSSQVDSEEVIINLANSVQSVFNMHLDELKFDELMKLSAQTNE